MPRVLVVQADRESNTEALDQLWRLKELRSDLDLAVLRRRAPWWQWDRSAVARILGELILVDPGDERAALIAACEASRRRKIDAVFTVHEECLRLTARIADALGLPGARPRVVERCRDKWALHETLSGSGVAAPDTRLTRSYQDAERAMQDLGLPVVVKPRDLAGGVGVSAVHRHDDLRRAFALAQGARWRDARQSGVLVQELVVGRTIAANAFVRGGQFTPLGVSDKTSVDLPYFSTHEEAMPSQLDDDVVWQIASQCAEAVGIRDAVMHFEMVVSDAGATLLEITPRPGGGPIPRMVEVTHGVWPVELALKLALGETGQVTRGASHCRARYLRPQEAGCVVGLSGGCRLPPQTEVRRLVQAGDYVAPPPRSFVTPVGWVLGWGDDRQEVTRRVATVAGRVRVRTAPQLSLAALRANCLRATNREYRRRLVGWMGQWGNNP